MLKQKNWAGVLKKINRPKHLLAFAGVLLAGNCLAAISALNLRCEYLQDPLGIDATQPRLSWILKSDERGAAQSAYQILVASSPKLLAADKGDLWDSGKVTSDETTQIEYAGQALTSRGDCFWKVRSWDQTGKAGSWSQPAHWQIGLLERSDWSAQWISAGPQVDGSLVIRHAIYSAENENPGLDVTEAVKQHIQDGQLKMKVDNDTLGKDPAFNARKHLHVEYELGGRVLEKDIKEHQSLVLPDAAPVPYFRKSFTVSAPVQHATLYVTALGLYEARINGQRIGDHLLAPDWTDYRQRIRYQTFDVTKLLKKGNNAIGALLANGWFSGHIGNGGFEFFGKEPALLAQLEITYADGRTERVTTDGTWKSHTSPILAADFMLGEDYDARKEIKNWDQANLDDSAWPTVQIRDESARKLEAQVMEPVREICELKPKSVKEIKPGCWVYDLGQNMVGVVRLKISAAAGTKITLRHAEMLNPDGTIYTTNLRGATSVDHYICKSGGTQIWQPRFTFHGFRYVEISGLDSKPGSDVVTGVVIGSDTPRAGEFSCSDPRINQLQSNIQWGQRGNYVSVPTDCPQRDERLGWMGDAEVFVRSATYNADVAAFFTKWLVDVDDGQSSEGAYGDVSPNTMGGRGTPAWSDAGVICPWTIYETYGDKKILEHHLPAMTKWIEFMREHSHDLIRDGDRGSDYGDWLSQGADTPKDLIGTAFFAYSTHLLAKSYRAVGNESQAQKYEQLFAGIKTAFNKKYVSSDGHITGDTQCGYAMALKFELLPDDMRPKAAQFLEADIKAKGNHLSTGFIGVGYLLPVLAAAGKIDTAYDLLKQDTFPSWLFSVKHGATTIWERWDGWTPDKGFQDPGMNSFNHYSLGSCGEFLFGGIGGIRPSSPGYKKILIQPVIHNGLAWAKASYNSINGKIQTEWRRGKNDLTLNLIVPANTTATVSIPATNLADITESGKPVDRVRGVKTLRQENGTVDLEIPAGTYRIKVIPQ